MQGIRNFGRGIKLLQREVKSDLKIQHMNILCKLALEHPDPVGYGELNKYTGMSRASTSRNMKLLGEWQQENKKGGWTNHGLGLVEVKINPFDTRELMGNLTDKGFELMKKLDKAVNP